MVIIHPTACSPAKIAAIQLSTGLKAIVGKRYARLVPKHEPCARTAARSAPAAKTLARDPHDGGHAA